MEMPTPRAILVCGDGQGAGGVAGAVAVLVLFDVPVGIELVKVELTVEFPAMLVGLESVVGVTKTFPAAGTVVKMGTGVGQLRSRDPRNKDVTRAGSNSPTRVEGV